MDDKAKLAWVMFFCAVKGWQHHPGTRIPLTTKQCAAIADDMAVEYLQREQEQWDGVMLEVQ